MSKMRPTKAIILAAGVGARLGGDPTRPPKSLLRFGGKSLLRRHFEILWRAGVNEVLIGVGYQSDRVVAEVHASAGPLAVRLVDNPEFRSGSVVTLASLAEGLLSDEPVLLMDADVLYDDRMMHLLMASTHENCLLLDRGAEFGEEPVKICVRDGRIVEFRKRVEVGYDFWGESVGFFRLSAPVARRIAERTETYLTAGRRDEPYEEVIRDLVLGDPVSSFGYEDVTGLPWIEIDFPDDVGRAGVEVFPRLDDAGSTAATPPSAQGVRLFN
jgi:choline kinase